MKITNELREYTKHYSVAGSKKDKVLSSIADRIDAEHEKEVRETGEDIVRDVKHDWIRLPKDADGQPIHVGDVMEFSAFEIEKPVTRMVDGIGQGVFFAWCGERGYQQHEAKRYRHYHAPTVEDVLREFGDWYAHVKGGCDEDGIIAEYAAKLRLAGDAE